MPLEGECTVNLGPIKDPESMAHISPTAWQHGTGPDPGRELLVVTYFASTAFVERFPGGFKGAMTDATGQALVASAAVWCRCEPNMQ